MLACALIASRLALLAPVVASAVAVAQRVDDHTLLVTVLDDDAACVACELMTPRPGPRLTNMCFPWACGAALRIPPICPNGLIYDIWELSKNAGSQFWRTEQYVCVV